MLWLGIVLYVVVMVALLRGVGLHLSGDVRRIHVIRDQHGGLMATARGVSEANIERYKAEGCDVFEVTVSLPRAESVADSVRGKLGG
jgi:hypothetical protein